MIGWFVLLAFLFAASDVRAVNDGGRLRRRDLHERARLLGREAGPDHRDDRPVLLRRGRRDQPLAHVVRVLARPRRCRAGRSSAASTATGVPFNAVIAVSVRPRWIIAIPALFGKNDIPFAFFALTGDRMVGLYLAYIIPVYLRLRAGDTFEPGPWNLGGAGGWSTSLAIIFVILVVFCFDLPFTPTGLPWNDGFDWSVVNYTPLAILLPLIFGDHGTWFVGEEQALQGPGPDDRGRRGHGHRGESTTPTSRRPPSRLRRPPRPAKLDRREHERLPAFVLARAPVVVLLRLDRAVDGSSSAASASERDHARRPRRPARPRPARWRRRRPRPRARRSCRPGAEAAAARW